MKNVEIQELETELRAEEVTNRLLALAGRKDRLAIEATRRGTVVELHARLNLGEDGLWAESSVDTSEFDADDGAGIPGALVELLTELAHGVGSLAEDEVFSLARDVEGEVWNFTRLKMPDFSEDEVIMEVWEEPEEEVLLRFVTPENLEDWLKLARRAGRKIFGVI